MNPIIQKAREALLAKVNPKLRPVIEKVAGAGQKVMYSEQTRSMAMEELKRGTDPESVGAAVAKLAAVLFNQSRNTIPPQVLFPATMLLLFEALEFLEEAGSLKVDAPQLAAYAQATGSAFLQMLGVTPEKLQGMLAGKGQQGAPQPAPQATQQPAGGIVGAAGG